MGQSEGTTSVLRSWDDSCLVRVVAQLLINAFLAHGWVIDACVSDRVPDEGCDSLGQHVWHEFELFAKLEAASERLFHELILTLFNHTLSVMHFHVEVVQVKRLEKWHDIREDSLRVAIVNNLLLRDYKLRENEILNQYNLNIIDTGDFKIHFTEI